MCDLKGKYRRVCFFCGGAVEETFDEFETGDV
jgi:hypothetical protein